MDCSCNVKGNETTTTLPVPNHNLKSQTILPKTSEFLPHKRKSSTGPVAALKPRNIYSQSNLETIKANAYRDWLRNQIR